MGEASNGGGTRVAQLSVWVVEARGSRNRQREEGVVVVKGEVVLSSCNA